MGIGVTLTGWTDPAVGWALIMLAVLIAVALLPPIANRIPHVALERGSRADGVALRIRPPEVQGVKRLRQETNQLVAEMHDYLRAHPAPWTEHLRDHQETSRAMNAATTENERERLWNESTQRMAEAYQRERQTLAAQFGGRLRYVLQEYRQRGMISESDASRLEWDAQSLGWLNEAASTLEALARRL